MHFRKTETRALIRAVKPREILWNNSHVKYFHKSRKKLAWSEVCGELFENFSKYDDVQQKSLTQDVMRRWRTIRDNYVRKCKQNAEAEHSGPYEEKRIKKKYIFEDELSFLSEKKSNRPASSCSNQSNLEQTSQHELFSEEVEETQSMSTSFLMLSPKREQESPADEEEEEDEKMALEETKEDHHSSELDPFDEDLGFFISLLPTVKSLSRMEKLDFRIKTMQLLQGQLGQRSSQGYSGTSSNGGFQKTEFSVCGDGNEQMFLSEND